MTNFEKIIKMLEEEGIRPVDFALGDCDTFINDTYEIAGYYGIDTKTDNRAEEKIKEYTEKFDRVKQKLNWEEVSREERDDYNFVTVRYFPDYDVYIKTVGYYSSYYGTDVDDYGVEVRPVEKVITVFQEV